MTTGRAGTSKGVPRTVRGTLDILPDGSAFFREAGRRKKPIRIARKAMPNFVLHGDTIDVQYEGVRGELKIERVVQRESVEFEGTLEVRRNRAFIVPDNPLAARRIFVQRNAVKAMKSGSRVLARIKLLVPEDPRPAADVLKTLDDAPVLQQVLADVCNEHGISHDIPKAVLADAESMKRREFAGEPAPLDDLRQLPLVTIDGFNAKDFDDAVWVQAETDGGFTAIVAIADVAGYVQDGGIVDTEAAQRGTSVYFPHRVFPMLPERLSNDLCSLVPGQDRPVVGVRLEFDQHGMRKGAKLLRGWMHSHARLTYSQVNAYLTQGDDEAMAKVTPPVKHMLKILETLAARRWEQRKARGALEFDLPEPEFVMGMHGDVSEILYRERGVGQRIVEELMIAANEAVAEILEEANLPIVFRCHQAPPPEKYDFFRKFAHNLGFTTPSTPTPEALQRVVQGAQGTPYERSVNVLVLRTMSQADYRHDNIGHFGLSLQHYCHFTSPIRRYPDLINHRCAIRYLARGGVSSERADEIRKSSEGLLKTLGERERQAEQAERTYAKSLKARFLEKRLGETFGAVVSGVAKFGIFVELENYLVEGLLSFRDIGDDYYVFDENRFEVWGKRTGRKFRIGDLVQVQLAKVDVAKGFIDFRLIRHDPLLYGRLAG